MIDDYSGLQKAAILLITLGPEKASAIFQHLKEDEIGNDIDIEVVNDANLDTSGCFIETSFGVFDCGIDMELNNLVKDIRSLCS